MWTRIVLLNLILVSGVSCCSCQKSIINTSEEVIQMRIDENMDDLKFMMEAYGLREDELDGLDLRRFIQDYQLRTRDYSAEEIRDIIEAQRDVYINDGTTALYSIFAVEGRDLWDDDEVNRIGYYVNSGTLIKRLIIDIDNKMYYIDSAEPHTLAITEEQVELLKNLPHKYEISKWERHTEGEESSSTGHFSWKLVFGLTSGEYCVYDGYTRDMSHLPDTFNDFTKELSLIVSDSLN